MPSCGKSRDISILTTGGESNCSNSNLLVFSIWNYCFYALCTSFLLLVSLVLLGLVVWGFFKFELQFCHMSIRVISQFLYKLRYPEKLIQISLYSTGRLIWLVAILLGEFHALWWMLLFGNISLPIMKQGTSPSSTSLPKFWWGNKGCVCLFLSSVTSCRWIQNVVLNSSIFWFNGTNFIFRNCIWHLSWSNWLLICCWSASSFAALEIISNTIALEDNQL